MQLTHQADLLAKALLASDEVAVKDANLLALLVASSQACGAFAVMDSGIVAIHRGLGFRFCAYASGVPAGGDYYILWVAGNNPPHATSALSTSGAARIRVYDAVTTTSDGTPIPIYNLNLGSLNTPETLAYHTPTFGVLGTKIVRDEYIPGGTGGTRIGSASRDNSELILAPNSKLVARITNMASGDIVISYTGTFYEEA